MRNVKKILLFCAFALLLSLRMEPLNVMADGVEDSYYYDETTNTLTLNGRVNVKELGLDEQYPNLENIILNEYLVIYNEHDLFNLAKKITGTIYNDPEKQYDYIPQPFENLENLEICELEFLDMYNGSFSENDNLKTIKLSGPRMSFSKMFYHCDNLESIDISGIEVIPNYGTNSIREMFAYCENLKTIKFNDFDTSSVCSMYRMFDSCKSLESLDLSSWDVSNVSDMASMFEGCKSLKKLDLSGWDVSNVRNMNRMFYWSRSLEEIDLSGWDTSSVSEMEKMFGCCWKLENIKNLENLDVSHVINMKDMFSGYGIEEIDLSGWDTSSVLYSDGMFANCKNLKKVNLGNFHTQSIKSMFEGCESFETLDLSGWDTSGVSNMDYAFKGCTNLESLDLSSWDTSRTAYMDYMFSGCTNLESLNLSGWDTSSVMFTKEMFQNCESLETLDLSGWDTSRVFDMSFMFDGCTNLKSLDLSGWNYNVNTNVTAGIFYSCDNLDMIKTPSNFGDGKKMDLPYIFFNVSDDDDNEYQDINYLIANTTIRRARDYKVNYYLDNNLIETVIGYQKIGKTILANKYPENYLISANSFTINEDRTKNVFNVYMLTNEPTPEPTPEPAPEPAPEPTPEPAPETPAPETPAPETTPIPEKAELVLESNPDVKLESPKTGDNAHILHLMAILLIGLVVNIFAILKKGNRAK